MAADGFSRLDEQHDCLRFHQIPSMDAAFPAAWGLFHPNDSGGLPYFRPLIFAVLAGSPGVMVFASASGAASSSASETSTSANLCGNCLFGSKSLSSARLWPTHCQFDAKVLAASVAARDSSELELTSERLRSGFRREQSSIPETARSVRRSNPRAQILSLPCVVTSLAGSRILTG